MKRITRVLGITVIVAVIAIMVFSCDLEDKKDGVDVDVDFTNYFPTNSYSILVSNHTGERLVAFRGELHPDMLIGGIPANTSNHGLPRNPALFNATMDFPLILLTEAQYNANKSNLDTSALRNSPFTRVFVFFNASGENNVVYELDSGLGGTNELRVTNNSNSINIELRRGGVAGYTIGYAPARMMETTIMLDDGNYQIFPVFKRYNRQRDILETIYPTDPFGDPYYSLYSFGDFGQGQSNKESMFNLHDLLKGLVMSSGAALVYIDNQTQDGVMFLEGNAVRKTLTGLEYIMPSLPLTFSFDMPTVPGTNNFADSRVVANWRFGSPVYNVPLQTSEDDDTPLSSLTLERDMMYTITISGNMMSRTLKAWISNETPIDTSDFNIN